MLVLAEPGTYESMSAAESLGKTHDPVWFPLLLEIANQHGAMYLPYAAESGGDVSITELRSRLHGPDHKDRFAVINALGHTGSRAAVPILIGLLEIHAGSKDEERVNIVISANAALMQLTHLYAEQSSDDNAILGWYGRWQHWWITSGPTASIYKPGECVADAVLP